MDIDDPQISFSLRVGCGGCEVVLGRVEELLTSYPDAELGALVYIDGEADEISRSYPRLVGHATVGFAGPSLDGSPGARPAAARTGSDGDTEWLTGPGALLALLPVD
jgi:hypothetical protein